MSSIWEDILAVRAQAPLVHNVTNLVVMNNTANALLALGASPVMAHALDEIDEMVGYASALVLNMGTLDPTWVTAMLHAGAAARRRGIPVVFDPVGSGATKYRTAVARSILDAVAPTIVRGNASEIASLGGAAGQTKGVDSTLATSDIVDVARSIAAERSCVVAVSGATDMIVDGTQRVFIENGHPMMPRVTGLGCTATAITGAFASVNASPFRAAVHALAVMGIAGEIAAERSPGPGSLQMHLLDALFTLTEADINVRLRLRET